MPVAKSIEEEMAKLDDNPTTKLAPPVAPVSNEGELSLPPPEAAAAPREIGGPKGLEPTRYGDWERKGRCVDF